MSHRFKRKTAGTAAMYRHFAVITVVCTAMLAMFADGDNAEAIAQQAAQTQQEQEAGRQEKAQRIAQVQQPGGVWGSDEGGFGTGSLTPIRTVSNMASSMTGDFFGRHSPDYLARLSAREREDLMQAMAENGADGTGLSKARTASLEDASRRRSGSLGLD